MLAKLKQRLEDIFAITVGLIIASGMVYSISKFIVTFL